MPSSQGVLAPQLRHRALYGSFVIGQPVPVPSAVKDSEWERREIPECAGAHIRPRATSVKGVGLPLHHRRRLDAAPNGRRRTPCRR